VNRFLFDRNISWCHSSDLILVDATTSHRHRPPDHGLSDLNEDRQTRRGVEAVSASIRGTDGHLSTT